MMQRALFTRDYSLAYIQQVGSATTPLLYNIAAMWSALEGSILLWVVILCRLHGRRRVALPASHRGSARRLGDGGDVHRAGVLRAAQLRAGRPVRRRCCRASRVRRPGPEPAAAEPRARAVPPADPLPRLRRDHGAVRLRHRRPRHRPSRRGVAARDPPLGTVRVGVPHDRDPAGRLVELRGARVERRVGVGSRRERQLPAVAHGDCLPALGPGAGASGGCCGSGT